MWLIPPAGRKLLNKTVRLSQSRKEKKWVKTRMMRGPPKLWFTATPWSSSVIWMTIWSGKLWMSALTPVKNMSQTMKCAQKWSKKCWTRNLAPHGMWLWGRDLASSSAMKLKSSCTCFLPEHSLSVSGNVLDPQLNGKHQKHQMGIQIFATIKILDVITRDFLASML